MIASLAALLIAAAGPVQPTDDVAARTKARLSAAIERLTVDDAEYGRLCARYADVAIDLSRGDLTDEAVACEHARHRRTAGTDLPPRWSGAPAAMPKAPPVSERPQ